MCREYKLLRTDYSATWSLERGSKIVKLKKESLARSVDVHANTCRLL